MVVVAPRVVELEQTLETMISRLPVVEQRVLLLRFGIGVREAQSRQAISRELRLEQHRVRYLEENAKAADVKLTDEDVQRIEEAFPKGATAGDRYPDMSTVNR